MPISEVYNEDCMVGLSRYEDNFFDLAIVDPPYGILNVGMKITKTHKSGTLTVNKSHAPKDWDKNRPTQKYFTELQRASKNQIIWGGNYFTDMLPVSGCWIFWDKINGEGSHFADGEFAWTSLKTGSRRFVCSAFYGLRGGKDRIHPTEKPIKLYNWVLKLFAQGGDKILDTHTGSGSSRIACWDGGFDFYGWEIDKDYFDAMEKRFNQHIQQLTLEL